MRNPRSVKQEFLQKWMKGLKKCRSLRKNMSLLERKKAIKLSADLAMASTRSRATRWSRALIASASSPPDDHDGYNKALADHILGWPAEAESQRVNVKVLNTTPSSSSVVYSYCSGRILNRSGGVVRRVKKRMVMSGKKAKADCVAKRLVQKRRRMLKSLLPGGEFMDDDVSLLEETLDYIQSLRAQVEVMRCLATASPLSPHPKFINNN